MNKMMNKKSIMAMIVTVSLLTVNVGTGSVNVYATENNKEEVIYINTDSEGSVENVNAVNIFDGGSVTDYGNYSNVKMLNTTDRINKNGDEITFSTDKDRVYYQGTMKNVQIPWNIEITYTLDGEKIKAEDLPGKSGHLVLKIKISKNKESKSDFYDSYALQASLTLDTEKCENINAEGATLANVGANKQISYTVLPQKGLDAEISADVKDFEMDAIAINGVKLDLNIDIDDKKITDKVKKLMNASEDINSGALKLSNGTNELKNGGSNLSKGADTLNSGAVKLNSGMGTLDKGVLGMEKALNKLNKKSGTLNNGSAKILSALKKIEKQLSNVSLSTKQLKELTDSSAKIKSGIENAYKGAVKLQQSLSYNSYKNTFNQNGLDIEQLQQGNSTAIQTLSSQLKELSENVKKLKSIPGYENNEEYKEQVENLEKQISNTKNLIILLKGNNAVISGTKQYFDETEKGAAELTQGLNQLKTSYEKFDKAIIKLTSGLSELAVNVSNLKSAIEQLVKSYSTLDEGIDNYTKGVASIVSAYSKISEGTGTLAQGSKELVGGAGKLKKGTTDLYDGIITLNKGAGTLSDGTEKLYNQTKGMDTKIEDEINDMVDNISGKNSEVKSFVSDKNKHVESVQFVIKTTPIEKPEQEEKNTETNKKLNFFEKLMKLFGL